MMFVASVVLACAGLLLALAAGADPGPSWQAVPAGGLIGLGLVFAYIAGDRR